MGYQGSGFTWPRVGNAPREMVPRAIVP